METLPSERNQQNHVKDLPKDNKALKVGVLVDELPDLNNVQPQVIYQKVKEAEKVVQYNEFKDKIGEIVNGVVKRVEYGNLIVDLEKVKRSRRKIVK